MLRGRLNSILVMVLALEFGVPLRAQNPAQRKADTATRTSARHDLAGVWRLARGQPGDNDVFTTEPVPFQPWAQEIFDYNLRPYDDELRARDEVNPQIRCIPYTFPRVVIAGARPFEIFHVPGRVLMLYERDHNVRQIWMDQDFPEGYPVSYMGYAIGRWDGDALVVETKYLGARKNNWLDSAGHLLSDAMHITERYHRPSHDTLVIDYRFDDPKVYARPWNGQRTFTLQPTKPGVPGVMEDTLCEDPLGRGGQ